MIYEWTTKNRTRNFGDTLFNHVYSEKFLNKSSNSETYIYFLIGSLISDAILDFAHSVNKTPVFVHCGWNGNELTKEKTKNAIFIGCRGEITRKKLSDLGINVVNMGDPIYGLNIEDYPQNISAGKTFFVPHISEASALLNPSEFGCTDYLSPEIKDKQDVIRIISSIKSAEFVLSGSMHVAMLAHKARVPFALFSSKDTQFVDHEVKWFDWLSIFDISPNEVEFSSEINMGMRWYSKIVSKLDHKLNDFDSSEVEDMVGNMIDHNELIRQHNELIRQHNELLNSRIWKLTKPYRDLINFIKK